LAAKEQALAKFPVLATTIFLFSYSLIVKYAPLNLKLPEVWKFSNFNQTCYRILSKGVSTIGELGYLQRVHALREESFSY